MRKWTRRQRLHIWIACFAILMNALVPSISHALNAMQPHGQQITQIEICTVDGIKYLNADGTIAVKSPLDSVLHHVEHCPYCVSDAATPPLPTTFATPLPVKAGMALFPALFYLAPEPLFTWSQPHSRAPPTA